MTPCTQHQSNWSASKRQALHNKVGLKHLAYGAYGLEAYVAIPHTTAAYLIPFDSMFNSKIQLV